MAFLKSSELLTYKLNSGTKFDASISATNVDIRLRDMEWNNENDRDNESSSYMNGTWFGSDESIVGKKKITASYSMKIAPGEYTPATSAANDAGHKLNYIDLFENCGLTPLPIGTDPTDDAPGLYAFYPDQTQSQKTMSIAQVMYDGEADKYQVAQGGGAMSNFSITSEGTAMPFTVAFDTMGRAEAVIEVDGSDITIASFDEDNVMRTVADSMRNTTIKITDILTLNEVEFCVTSLTFESGNELNEIECQATDSGLDSYLITKINPSLVIDPLLRTLSDFDWWDAVSSERFYKIEIDSEFVSIYIPRAQINGNSVGESNGQMRNELTFRPLVNIDGDFPTWISGSEPANVNEIPYFIGIRESLADY